MKQITVISGKGGTGKTVISGAFAALAEKKVMVDCDVDAADLHLLLHPEIKERHEFKGGQLSVIDEVKCDKCGKCAAACRFGGISPVFKVEVFSCQGCGLCSRICPRGAIRMKEKIAGEWFVSDTAYGVLVHARLGIAEDNSGRLVSRIRQAAEKIAAASGADYIIIDGPPGIGCPVIASLTGTDLILVVTEPTLSGLHDAARVIELAGHFKIPAALAVNKYDLNPGVTEKIEAFCLARNIPLTGKVPFDKTVVRAVVEGKVVTEYPGSPAAGEIRKIWDLLKD
ncbi:MAG: 4Fe-4S binding protein [Candidatus Omnitrophica bacterium]|nr:4Fe-4S binding protein [Candidatus Omnitrophota bacterium]MDD5725280.1 4Fe-4S binding protein [Candidatus Omnitrophota bacterium]